MPSSLKVAILKGKLFLQLQQYYTTLLFLDRSWSHNFRKGVSIDRRVSQNFSTAVSISRKVLQNQISATL